MNDQLRSKLIPFVFVSVGCLAVIFGLSFLQRPTPAEAAGGDLNNAVAKYPNISGTRLDSCSLCHTSNIPGLNAYGADYKAKGRNSAAFTAIESLDSDNDGFTNLAELKALTFPGNANDRPAAAPTATATKPAQPTNTPTALPQPTKTATQPPQPTATATLPPQPTQTATLPPAPTSTTTAVPQPTATVVQPPSTTPTSDPYPAPQPTATVPAPTQPPQPTATSLPPTPAPKPTATQPPATGQVKINPSADAYVAKDSAKSNYGSKLDLRADDNPRTRSYLRFNLPQQDYHNIGKATLSLYVNSSSGSGFSIHLAGGSRWSEGSITYSNAPSVGKTIASASGGAGTWVTLDVTSLVRSNRSITFVLVANNGATNSFASRESGNAPVLTLETSGKGGGDGDGEDGDD